MNTKIEHEDSVEYRINEPTLKAAIVTDSILEAFKSAGVDAEEVLPVLGEAVIRLLSSIANLSGYEPLSLIKSFGEGIVTAEIEFMEHDSNQRS